MSWDFSTGACEVCGGGFTQDRAYGCLRCGRTHPLCAMCALLFRGGGAEHRVVACPDECRAAAELLGFSGQSQTWPVGSVASAVSAARRA